MRNVLRILDAASVRIGRVTLSGAMLAGVALAAVVIAGVRSDLIGWPGGAAEEVAAEGESVVSSPADAPLPPPSIMAYLDKKGMAAIPIWDDRDTPGVDKVANPWINPRWAPFNRCMVAAGLGLPEKTAAGTVLYQSDMDAIVAAINAEGPFLGRSKSGPEVRMTPGLRALGECAAKSLELTNAELEGLLLPGDPTGEMPRSSGSAPE